MDILELFAGVGGFRLGLEKSNKIFLKQNGLINGNLQKNHKMPLKFITFIIMEKVKT